MNGQTDKTRILILSANPGDTQRLALDKEYSAIMEILEKSGHQDLFEIELSAAARAEDLRAKILNFKPRVVHFCGHGEDGALAFEAEGEGVHWIEADALVELFRLSADHLECVVFNACYSESLAESVSQHIDYVVGMNHAIGDKAAIQYSRGFYTALFAGRLYPVAHDHGRNAIQMANIPEHLTPQLKIKPKARRRAFTPGYKTDILICCHGADGDWAKTLKTNLDDLLAQRFGHRNIYKLETMNPDREDVGEATCRGSAVLVAVRSRDFEVSSSCQASVSLFLKDPEHDDGSVFLAEIDSLVRPESLQKAWYYRFHEPKEKDGGQDRTLTPTDTAYHNQLDQLAVELYNKLCKLKEACEQRAEEKKRRQRKEPAECADLPEGFLFVNAATEDRDLLSEIVAFLDNSDAEYSLPLSYYSTPSPSDMRRDLTNQIAACDYFIVLYGHAPDTGSRTWWMVRFKTSAQIRHHRSELAPPPTM